MLEKANRLGNSRETVLTDMIVDMDTVFAESTRGTLLQEKLREREAEIHITDRQGLYALSWRRRWESEWNDELDAFLPYPDGQKRVKEEHFLLVFLETKDLCDLVEQGENGLDAWAEKLKESAPRKRIMLMTEGLEIYYRKRRTAKRRDFEQQVLHRLDWSAVDGSGGSNRRRRTQADVDTGLGPTKDDIESALTYLQFMQDVMLVPTNDQAETIDWMVAMTAEIARAPYRMVQRRSRQGPARSGLDASDTWNKMLQEIQLCTPAVAKSVATEYPKLQDLHKAYQAKDTQKDREDMLAHLSVERSAISARDRTVNDAMSKKICTVFTSDDPDEVIT
ncbi:hypothetical protein BCR43DRAFT_39850 [Syncephalastrum racemosum]|uniref:ERCC4 domain-containing protein n=1 Tax=Syncephalastrum racemosum TaxID=13706 RepID=A0A1X2HUF6_SYNRA|nr:hypothetical protein BCR43DRAFT_39850 [Syncephalastrum racemosum]